MSQEVLLNSFLSYLSRDERALVENALRHRLNDEQSEDWLDFLDRFGCKRVPTPEQIRDTILEIAHKEQIIFRLHEFSNCLCQQLVRDQLPASESLGTLR